MTDPRKRIADLISGYRKAKILFVAASLDLFSHTAGRGGTAEAVAKRLGTDPRATRVLLNALVSTGFLTCRKLSYFNSAVSGRFLVPGRKEYLGNNLCYQDIIWEAWGKLGAVVKSGKTSFPLRRLLSKRKDFLEGYIKGMSNIAGRPAAEIAGKLDLSGAGLMLDVGGGPGTYTASFLGKERGLKGVILDLPETLSVTRGIFSEHPLSGRVSFQEGDYHKADFGKDRYDLVLFSNVTHDEGPAENLELLRKAFKAMRSGGQVVIHDFMLNDDMTSPQFAALFSVHMLVYTNKGRVYSAREYGAWLKKAGFGAIRQLDICPKSDNPSKILVGRK